jgi:hypothetical protein
MTSLLLKEEPGFYKIFSLIYFILFGNEDEIYILGLANFFQ